MKKRVIFTNGLRSAHRRWRAAFPEALVAVSMMILLFYIVRYL